MLRVLLFLAGMTALLSADAVNDAYRLYKAGEYELAYSKYHDAYKENGNIKAAYNIAVMIEQQKFKDPYWMDYRPKEAAKWYKKVADSVPVEKNLKPEYCHKEIYPYYLKSFKKLSLWYEKGHFVVPSAETAKMYRKKAAVLKTYCSHHPHPKHSTVSHPKNYQEQLAEEFIQKCPAAKVIPSQDRVWIDRYPCVYYKKFPKRMKKILNLAQYYRLYSDLTAGYQEEKKKVINRKARKIARPILSYVVEHEVIPCYKKAKTDKDLEKCYYYYLSDCQAVTFGVEISCAGTYAREEKKAKKITEEERQESIREIREELKKGDICPPLVRC